MTLSNTSQPAIAILPYGHKLSRDLPHMPLDRLEWPLGCPDRLRGGTVADLGPEDHLIVFLKTAMHYQSHAMLRARLSVMLMEPKIISARHHMLLRLSHRRFFRVFTYNPDLLKRLPNAVALAFGTTWVPNWQELDLEKDREISLIASAKRDHPGHKLRHQVVDGLATDADLPVTVLGRGYAPFDAKADGHARYRYSVVIENVQETNYFTEKLLDAILCDCVPIYWGCPNIADFMDPAGLVVCNSADDIRRAMQNASAEDFAARLPHLHAIKERAVFFGDLYGRAARALMDEL